MKMKYSKLFLKITLLVVLFAIMLAGILCGGCLVLAGIFSALYEHSVNPLVLVIPGLFACYLGFVALDTLEYINNKWSWTA